MKKKMCKDSLSKNGANGKKGNSMKYDDQQQTVSDAGVGGAGSKRTWSVRAWGIVRR